MLTLLVMEDDPAVSQALGGYFRSLGMHVEEATTITEAKAALATECIDCVLSDYFVDGGTVREIARIVKAQYPGIPLILLSGTSHHSDPSFTIDASFVKPCDLGGVARTIRQLVAQKVV
jgi:two-component system cell cycle sensor histidine kinase/response regulator CckA